MVACKHCKLWSKKDTCPVPHRVLLEFFQFSQSGDGRRGKRGGAQKASKIKQGGLGGQRNSAFGLQHPEAVDLH